ncbi:YhcH/YjgK/YiaL family protein [Rhodopirellula rubra]|uniref:YhcH/YjgK/YiaL family protein n=1 Tax=Aporhodopirellula rubra TaxID=980271 RepID=A0A7W5DXX5_9BACT|nr:YhcH/YjgK/YiaL family protein [Aporhodopirellula rubra]
MFASTLEDEMTIDWLCHSSVFQRCIEWLHANSTQYPAGITKLEGDQFFVNVHGYETKHRTNCRWESHRRTVDLQYCISGSERIDWTNERFDKGTSDYDEQSDFELWNARETDFSSFELTPRRFVIFFSGEPHRPMVLHPASKSIHKLVFKIDMELLAQ